MHGLSFGSGRGPPKRHTCLASPGDVRGCDTIMVKALANQSGWSASFQVECLLDVEPHAICNMSLLEGAWGLVSFSVWVVSMPLSVGT